MMNGYLILTFVYVMNVLTFILYGDDKRRALQGKRRIPEFVLFLLSFWGGAFGALFGMWMFHHKTRKTYFYVLNIIFFIAIVIVLYLLGYVYDILPDTWIFS